nr:cytoplasmic helicases retinoic acid-inducible protein I [Andrias davidianus]
MTEQQKRNLEQYSKYIHDILTPRRILGYMRDWLNPETIERIVAEEDRSVTAAAAMLLECLLKLDAEGWFRGFLDGLNAAGYTGLCQAIENWDFEKIQSLEDYKKLLCVIEPTVKNEIKPPEIVQYLTNCVIQSDIEEILKISEMKGPTAGAEKLINCLLRSDKEEWPKTFCLALEYVNSGTVLELWNVKPGNAEEPSQRSTENGQDEDTSAFSSIHYSEEPEKENSCSSPGSAVSSGGASSSLAEAAGISTDLMNRVKLRAYQIELAQPALRGKNTIICAPTGSGKTIVSLLICEQHLKTQPAGQKGKVLFLATKVPVYEQQKNVFKQHFENSEYTVAGISGETHESAPSGMIFERHDIIVLTPQILVNNLEDGCIPSLAMFTLLIFDECHNTTGNHPYSVLMYNYLDMKLGSGATRLPQIIGLTASVGVGKAKNVREASEYICKLCAILDAHVISTVREHREDLERIVFKPHKIIRDVGKREKNHFFEIISKMMAETEEMAKSVYPSLNSLSNIQNHAVGTQKYEQWIVDTQKRCRLLQMKDKMEESLICRTLFTYTEHLRKYNDALMINDDARTKDALDYLQEFFTNVKNGGYDETEKKLTENFEARQQELRRISDDELNENPKLDDLTCILDDEYRQNPQTRTLLFVKTRALVTALKNWIEESPVLSYLKPDILIGRGKRDQCAGMTLPSQKGVLDTFKSSTDSKMLIATSVADEGIDIAQCNLVLLYEYVGNVIKMIQVRGRGRAKDSKCILVTSKPEQAEKEKINIYHEDMMMKALEELQQLNENVFLKKIDSLQRAEKTMHDIKKLSIRVRPEGGNKRLLCGKCKTFACFTEDIRTIQGSHHAVFDKTFEERYITKPHPKPRSFMGFHKKSKIMCKDPKCLNDWGITGHYLTLRDIPLIKIESFVVEDIETGDQRYFPKWIGVNFTMKEFDIAELNESTPNHLQ